MQEYDKETLVGDIVIADDSQDNLRVLSKILKEHGHKVRPVMSGEKALKAILAQPPDLILLDITMPDLNGFEVCIRLKALQDLKDIPVIFISGLADIDDKVHAFEVGGVDYITKPFKIEEVIARVDTHLKLRTLQNQLQQHTINLQSLVDERTKALKITNENLTISEEKFRKIFDNANDAIFLNSANEDLCGQILDVNAIGCNLLGLEHSAILKMKLSNLISDDCVSKINSLNDRLKSKQRTVFEGDIQSKDGHMIPIEMSSQYFVMNNELVLVSIARDITERRQSQEKLYLHQNRMRKMAIELSLVEENERRNIAVNIHDYIGQALAISKIKLGNLKRGSFSPEVQQEIAEIDSLIAEAVKYTRTLTFELSLPILYELGFPSAIEWLSEKFSERHGIEFTVVTKVETCPMSDALRTLLFKMVRELYFNIVKHAKARHVVTTISKSGENFVIVVHDDGIGFEINPETEIGNTGFGIFSIRERLQDLQGRLVIESAKDSGTRITIVVPVDTLLV